MNDDSRIYVDAAQPATVNDGAGKLTDCATLQEAVSAWLELPTGDGRGDWRAGLYGTPD